MKFKFFSPRFGLALLRNIVLLIRHRGSLKMNPFNVYIEAGVRIVILRGGQITFHHRGHRIYITRGCDLYAVGGTLEIGAGTFLNKNCTVDAHEFVSIGKDAMLAPNVNVFDSDHKFDSSDIPFRLQGYKCSSILIEDNVWIGANSVVTKGSKVGSNVVVGANSVVRGVLRASSVYVGQPVRFVRSLES